MIARDHGDANAAAMAFVHGLDRLLARWVEQADEAEQDQIFRQVGRTEAARFNGGTLEPRERQHALSLAGELVGGAHEVRAIDRPRLAAGGLLSIAVIEDHFGRALDEEKLLAVGGLVERRHELVLRLERDGVDPRRCCLLGLPVHAKLGPERIEGPLSWISFHLPGAILFEQLSVVAEHADTPHEVEHGLLARRLSVLLDLAPRRIAIAGDLICRLGGDRRNHHHFHEGERAGLVGADARYRA